MTLAPYVAILGRGQGRARSLTMDEARAAMEIILSGEGAPEAIGAILMLLRMKGEVAEEIAGFTAAARAAQAGHPVLLHGWNSHQATGASVRAELGDVGIAQVDWDAAPAELGRSGIAYVPLEKMHPRLMDLLRLRDIFGLRSCINTVLRMLNPAIAPVALQGVFHPSYRELQRDAASLLGQPTLRVLKGGGGEFEHHPAKDITLHGLNRGDLWEGPTGAPMTGHHRLSDTDSTLSDVWNGVVQDDFATAIITSTAALALAALGVADAGHRAQTLWQSRLHPRAA